VDARCFALTETRPYEVFSVVGKTQEHEAKMHIGVERLMPLPNGIRDPKPESVDGSAVSGVRLSGVPIRSET